jgi:hypothetical protein
MPRVENVFRSQIFPFYLLVIKLVNSKTSTISIYALCISYRGLVMALVGPLPQRSYLHLGNRLFFPRISESICVSITFSSCSPCFISNGRSLLSLNSFYIIFNPRSMVTYQIFLRDHFQEIRHRQLSGQVIP